MHLSAGGGGGGGSVGTGAGGTGGGVIGSGAAGGGVLTTGGAAGGGAEGLITGADVCTGAAHPVIEALVSAKKKQAYLEQA